MHRGDLANLLVEVGKVGVDLQVASYFPSACYLVHLTAISTNLDLLYASTELSSQPLPGRQVL